MSDVLVALLGGPVALHELKHKPGRRRTSRAVGPTGTAIVKVYASGRTPTVAARVRALAAGPRSLRVPTVLHVDEDAHMLVLSDIPGEPLRRAVLDADHRTCERAGAALGAWHLAWRSAAPPALSPHTVDRELAILARQAAGAPDGIASVVGRQVRALGEPWPCTTAVHRDLYEEQVLVDADGDIGLIDLDDAALGPPELDLGNLLAHLDLLALRTGADLATAGEALLDGYARTGPGLDSRLVGRCRRLTLLRLACIHAEPALLDVGTADQSASR